MGMWRACSWEMWKGWISGIDSLVVIWVDELIYLDWGYSPVDITIYGKVNWSHASKCQIFSSSNCQYSCEKIRMTVALL